MRHGSKDVLLRKQNIWAVFFCAVGIGLNLLAGALVSMLGLPLYLDTLGSIVIAALGGTLPGVIVGFVTNIIKGLSDQSSVYYGFLNVLIAFCAARLAHRGFFKNLRGIVVSRRMRHSGAQVLTRRHSAACLRA